MASNSTTTVLQARNRAHLRVALWFVRVHMLLFLAAGVMCFAPSVSAESADLIHAHFDTAGKIILDVFGMGFTSMFGMMFWNLRKNLQQRT